MGFVPTKSDSSLFVYKAGSDMAYLLLYVDDIVLSASSSALLQWIISHLGTTFAMKDIGPLKFFLGVQVTHTAQGFFLSQEQYTEDVIDRAGMANCKSTITPVDTKPKLSTSDGQLVSDASHYRSIVGALQYLTLMRPDVAYAVNQACLHMHAPRDAHWNLVKRILWYLRGTITQGLHITKSASLSLVAYSDTDWAGCPDTRRSTSGYCMFLGDSLVSRSSKRQTTVSRSSAEAEYRAVANAAAECCWIWNLLGELYCPIDSALSSTATISQLCTSQRTQSTIAAPSMSS